MSDGNTAIPWEDRYLITSTRGRVYTRAMALWTCASMCGPGNLPAIRSLLDDDAFMMLHRGETPSALAHAVEHRLMIAGNFVVQSS